MSVREVVKVIVRGVASVGVLPLLCSFHIRAWLLGRDRALLASTQLLSLLPGLTGQYLRRAFLRRTIAHCHTTAVVEFGTTLSRVDARLDEGTYIGPGCHLGLVHVERDALIASGVHVPSGPTTHGIDELSVPIREQPRRERLVRIGAGAWIGESAVVMAHVAAGTVVGAGAVVTQPLPPAVVAAGVPARVLRLRSDTMAVTG